MTTLRWSLWKKKTSQGGRDERVREKRVWTRRENANFPLNHMSRLAREKKKKNLLSRSTGASKCLPLALTSSDNFATSCANRKSDYVRKFLAVFFFPPLLSCLLLTEIRKRFEVQPIFTMFDFLFGEAEAPRLLLLRWLSIERKFQSFRASFPGHR